MFRKTLLFHLLLLTPLCFFNLIKWQSLKTASEIHSALSQLKQSAENFSKISALNKKVVSRYQGADSNYLYREVENFSFSNKKNKVQLIESPLFENAFYKEKLESLAKPIQVDVNDLRALLSKIEEPFEPLEKRPHVCFSDFSLKKSSNPENLFYDLTFKLIKREYL